MEITETFFATTRQEFRSWLERHHQSKSEIWLAQYKKATGKATVDYDEAVMEALCFGWIDGIRKRIDEGSFATRFTPRKPGSSAWSERNLERVRRLIAEGQMTAAGYASLPPDFE